MSETQAIETEDEILTEEVETDEVEVETSAEAEEVEIVVEGEDAPASKPVHKNGLQKRFGKMAAKINTANTQAEEAQRRAEMLEEENKLLRLKAQQPNPATRPDEDDFDTRQEYLAALDAYDDARIAAVAAEKAAEIIQANQAQNTQAQSEDSLNQQIDEHYERAASLKIANYSDLEGVAVDLLGNDIAKQIIANSGESHLILAHLGANKAKAESLKQMIETNPMKGVMEIGRLASSLKVKPKNSTAPDPETRLSPGSGVSSGDGGPRGATYE